jgi:hypothetical protein
MHHKSRLFLGFPLDASLRISLVHDAGADLGHHPIGQAIYICRKAKLSREHDGPAFPVISKIAAPLPRS